MKKNHRGPAPLLGALAVATGQTALYHAVGRKREEGPLQRFSALQLRGRGLKKLTGNAEQYHPENVQKRPDSPLAGRRLLFLGSSVTLGACSLEVSMADYLAAVDGCVITKEAVSGTTLADTSQISYFSRLKMHSAAEQYDAVVIQISTNDARQGLPLGKLSDSQHPDSFDLRTTLGGLEAILCYVVTTWSCPVFLYTGSRFDSLEYQQIVDCLPAVRKKWGVHLIDLWSDPELNTMTESDYALYMHDPVHPTQAGYLLWWLPFFERALAEGFAQEALRPEPAGDGGAETAARTD